MIRIHVSVYGRVQAVGFRYFTFQLAHQYELTGWVRNLDDGSVEIESQGDSETIEKFLTDLRAGNGYSRVNDIHFYKTQLVPNDLKFVIFH